MNMTNVLQRKENVRKEQLSKGLRDKNRPGIYASQEGRGRGYSVHLTKYLLFINFPRFFSPLYTVR